MYRGGVYSDRKRGRGRSFRSLPVEVGRAGTPHCDRRVRAREPEGRQCPKGRFTFFCF